MSDLRVLTDAELDFVSGGLGFAQPRQPIVIRVIEEVLVDILKILEGNTGRPQPVAATK